MPGRGGIDLREALEQPVEAIGGNADAGVGDFDAQEGAAVRADAAAGIEDHMALVGELDGVADEIHDDLAQAAGIAARQHRNAGRDVDDELDALHRGLQGGGGDGLVDDVTKVEVHVLQLQPIASIFDRSSTSLIRRAGRWRCRG